MSTPRELNRFPPIGIFAPAFLQHYATVPFTASQAFGKLRGKSYLTVYTSVQYTACGYPFRLGIEYFIPRTH
jgi:hypothetical protein